jgi:hypothetical protein
MPQLRLRYEGNGVFRTATHLDFEEAAEQYDQGDVLNADLAKPRSLSQNRYFHAMIEAAHENQRGGPRFANWRTLKGYLLVTVDHCTERRMKLPQGTPRPVAVAIGKGLALLIRSSAEYIGLAYDPNTNEIVARFPGSMKMRGHGSIGGEEANEIVDRVKTLICEEIIPGADPALVDADARARIGLKPKRKAA